MPNKKDILNETIKDLFYSKDMHFPLDVRTYNCLQEDNILTICDLVQSTEVRLFKIPNFGKKSMVKVKDALAMYGLTLGMTLPKKDEPIVKENIIYKDVEKERIVYKDKFVYKDKVIEKIVNVNVEKYVDVPALSKCIICNSYPHLKHGSHEYIIICPKCKTQVNVHAPAWSETLFPEFYKAINQWNKLGAHLIKKSDTEDVQNDQ